MTVVETPSFLRDAAAALSEQERANLVTYLATNPEAGEIMAGTGGIRKLRWAVQGRGKRGGARVIYYYHSALIPLFLLNVFPKNEKANLSQAERNDMRQLVPRIVAGYQKRLAK